jgi:hypothetical protein
MIYKFVDIQNEEIEKNSQILFVAGSYPIFSNMIVDRSNDLCKGAITFDLSLFDEFNLDTAADAYDKLDFDSYLTYVKGRKMVGKWFCSVDYKNLNKKQQESLVEYMKYPSDNGLLVVVLTDWRDIKGFSKNKSIQKGSKLNLIDLSWPNRKVLQDVLLKLFKDKGVDVDTSAIQLFIMRMGNQYNDYMEEIDKICLGNDKKRITYQMMLSYLDGVTNYAIDDFVMAIIKPVKNDKVVITRKAYKVLHTLVDDLGARGLVMKLRSRVNLYIEYRLNINNGNIPILVPYSVKEVQEKLPDNSIIKNVSDVSFKRNAKIASLTSIRDWYFIKMILNSANNSNSDEDYMRVLLAVIHRAIFNQDRLLNVIGVKDILDEGLYDLDIRKVGEDFENEE